jgi:hypothetical protein
MKSSSSQTTGLPSYQNPILGGRYITKKQLAEYLSCSVRQIEKLAARKLIPQRTIGRRMVRYDLARVEAALARFDKAAIGEDRT